MMEIIEMQNFAERVRKNFYYKAELCEILVNKGINVESDLTYMSPVVYNPFNNFHVEACVIAFAAFDGLSSIWQAIDKQTEQQKSNKKRFVCFLQKLNISEDLERVSTPFLYYFLKKYDIEEPFKNEIKKNWIDQKGETESHRVYSDPKIDEITRIYKNCHSVNPISSDKTIADPDKSLKDFTYAALIYKFYRCSFIHEFRASKYAVCFNKGNQISVRKFESHMLPSGEFVKIDDVKPQLDVGIGLFTESIRKGADTVHNLILKNKCIDIPYNVTDEIEIKVKRK